MSPSPMTHAIARTSAIALASCAIVSLTGCSGSFRTDSSSADPKPVATDTLAPKEAVTESQLGTLSARLTELSVNLRRTYDLRRDFDTSTTANLTLAITLRDGDIPRLFRLREGSSVDSIIDPSGRNLNDRSIALLPQGGPGRDELIFSNRRNAYPSAERSGLLFQVTLPIRTLPSALSAISGKFMLEPLVKDDTVTVQLGAMNEPISAAPGLTLVPKTIDVDTSSHYLRSAVIEVSSERNTQGEETTGITTIDLFDNKGALVATLGRREEYLVGRTIRRTFSLSEGSASRQMKDRTITAARMRTTTFGEPLTFPFTFQNIDLIRDE